MPASVQTAACARHADRKNLDRIHWETRRNKQIFKENLPREEEWWSQGESHFVRFFVNDFNFLLISQRSRVCSPGTNLGTQQHLYGKNFLF